MVFSPLLLAAGAIATSVLNSRERFGAAALAPLVYNLAMIFGAIALVPAFGVQGLAYGVVLGALGHIVVQVPSLVRIGARIRPFVDLRDDQARTALLLMVPRAIGLGATQIVFLVMTSLATTLGAEAVVGVQLRVRRAPDPDRGDRRAARDRPPAVAVARGGARCGRGVHEAGHPCPCAARLRHGRDRRPRHRGLGRSRAPPVRRGEHGGERAHGDRGGPRDLPARPDRALADHRAGALLLCPQGHEDARSPPPCVAVAANIVVANLLIGPLGLNGLAAAIAISAWLETMVLVVLLLRRVPGIRPGMGHVWVVMAKTVLVSFAGALVAYAIDRALVGAWGVDPGFLLLLVRISLAVAAGGLVIVAGSLALRIDELRSIVGVMTDLVRRRGRA